MLTYKNLAKKSYQKSKDKRFFLTALIMVLPTLINLIISTIVLKDFTVELNKIVESINEILYETETLITQEIINSYTTQIIDLLIANISSLIITGILSLIIFIISTALVYVVYYLIYMIANKEEINIRIMMGYIPGGIWLSLLYCIKIFLWSLLFVIPGIIKSFSYALCFYIKVENPHMKAKDCIKKSQQLMNKRKERLFIQYLLFILIYFIASFVTNIVLTIISIFLGNFIYTLCESYIYFIFVCYWYMNIAIYYDEVKKDEKYLDENPGLREQGITGRIQNERPRIRIVYGPPQSKMNDPYNTEEGSKIYDANPFSEDRINKENDPFED